MRKQLGTNAGIRGKFKGRFVRLGKKINFKGFSEETILLAQITDVTSNKTVADHLWFAYNKAFQSISLSEGVVIEFEARVKEYTKGYVNKQLGMNRREKDYKLSHPTRVKVVGQ